MHNHNENIPQEVHEHTPFPPHVSEQVQKQSKRDSIFHSILAFLAIGFTIFTISQSSIQIGGDIVEYYGMTESFSNHLSFNLTEQDKTNIEERFGEGYFKNSEYYIEGRDGQQYPTHFFGYSLLNLPARTLLSVFHDDLAKMFKITNILLLFGTMWFIGRNFVHDTSKRILLLALTLFSPILSLLSWQGPEVYIFCMLLISFFYLSKNRITETIIFSTLAAWQSQPLILIPAALLAVEVHKQLENKHMGVKEFYRTIGLGLMLIVPNIYYFFTLGTFSAFAKIQAVSFSNVTPQRILEFFIDPNIGIFFYMPVLCIIGLIFFLVSLKRDPHKIISAGIVLLIITLFASISNWNHGTAGFGPSRYSVFIVAALIIMAIRYWKPSYFGYLLVALVLVFQAALTLMNGGINPDFNNSHKHTIIAQSILTHAPQFYNPSPEIFFERTTGNESAFFGTIAYKDARGKCTKAYALRTDFEKLKQLCGSVPAGYETALDNEFSRIASFPRKVRTTEATFYPAEGACAWDFKPTKEKPFTCIRTLDNALDLGVRNKGRWEEVGTKGGGIWHFKWGPDEEVTVPPGYIINYFSFDAVYVNYPKEN